MGIGKRLRWPFSNSAAAVVEAEPEPVEAESTPRGRLVILVSDAAGFASFKTHTFFDAETAAAFIKTWYGKRIDKDNGIIAFWAMTQCPAFKPEPGSDAAVEAIVIVRDAIIDNIVYPFSFVSLAEAHAFMRFELERGANPELLGVYWAVPVQMGITAEGAVRLYPEEPPEALPAEHPLNERPVLQFIDWSEPSGPADPMEALFRKAGRNTRSDVRPGTADIVAEASEIAEAADGTWPTSSPVETLAEVDLNATGGITPEGADAPTVESTATVQVDQMEGVLTEGADEAVDPSNDQADELEPPETSDEVNDAGAPEVESRTKEEPVSEKTGEPMTVANTRTEERAVAPPAAPQAPKPARPVFPGGEPAGLEFPAGRASVADGPRFDAKEELQKVLRVRRWDEREGPFSGFNSPPGRF